MAGRRRQAGWSGAGTGLVVRLLCGGLLWGGWQMAQATAVAAEPAGFVRGATVEGITEYRLANGLQVLLVPDASRPTVTVNLTVFVGSRHEGYGEAGMAHLLEHMVFKGTPTHPKIPQVLQARGARFNGTTWVDRTNYFETLPATDENLLFALKLEADRMVHSFIKAEDLASEMTVVRNEFERGENSPSRVLGQRMLATAYEWHNYGKSTIGNRSDIERVPVENLREFYERFYQPDNALVVVAGQFDETKALKYIDETFGRIPRPTRKLNSTYTQEPPQDGERLVTLRRVGDIPLVAAMYHIPAGPHPEFAAVEILEYILTAAPSGRLYKALVETRKASSISGVAYGWHDPGVIRFMAEVTNGNAPEIVLETLLDTLDKVVAEGVTEREVERARVQILKQRELSAADTSGLAVELSDWAAQGDWRLYFLHRDRVEQVTPADVQAAAKKYLQLTNRTVGMFLPAEKVERAAIPEAAPASQQAADYKGRDDVALGEAFDVSPSHIESRTQRKKLATGLPVALLPKKTRGAQVQVRLVLRYGTAESLRGRVSACEFLPDLMLRGTKMLSREELQDELDIARTRISSAGSVGTAVFTVQTQRKYLPKAVDLLRQILREPTLPDAELEILRQRQLAGLEKSRTDPQGLAGRELGRRLSPLPPEDVRYLPTIEEEVDRVQQLDRHALVALHEEFLNGAHGELAVVGDFEPDEMLALAETLVADWQPAQPYARIPRVQPPENSAARFPIKIADKPNAVYYAGLAIPLKDDAPDYPALVIGNFILGAGALSSRLGDRIRQKEGLSYGVSSSFQADSLDPRATLSVFAISNPDNLPKVEKAVQEECARLWKDGPQADELKRAVEGYLQRIEVGRTDDATLAQILTSNMHAGRTMQFQAGIEAQIRALTPEQVTQTLQNRIDPRRLIVIAAGDLKD